MRIHVPVFLLKPEANKLLKKDPESLLEVDDSDVTLSQRDVRVSTVRGEAKLGKTALFVIRKKKRAGPPDWVTLLEQISTGVTKLFEFSKPNSAVLFASVQAGKAKVGSYTFAMTFGRGKAALRKDLIVPRFGLRCALSLVDPDRMATVAHKEVDLTTFYTKQQASMATPFRSFAMDADIQMLGGIGGSVVASTPTRWASRVAGRDSLHLNPALSANNMVSFLNWLVTVHEGESYKKSFDWIDRVAEVRDKSRIKALNAKLYKELSKSHPKGVYFNIPEPVEETDIPQFKFGTSRPSGDKLFELDLETFLGRCKSHRNPGLRRRLEKDYVWVVDDNDEATGQKWKAFKCLAAELKDRGTVVLHAGTFYEVERDFETKIDGRISRFVDSENLCPVWPKAVTREEDYNRNHLVTSLKGSVLLDKKCVTTYRGHATVEVADVFWDGKETKRLLFVKKYDGSAPLSHLFAQASVSSNALNEDENFRKDTGQKFPKMKPGLRSFNPKDWEIRICIATKDRARKVVELPFFSKLSLAHRATAISAFGYTVAVEIFAVA